MDATVRRSESLVASLCHEAEGLRGRGRQLLASLGRCQDPGLLHRLERELIELQARRRELLHIARRCSSQPLCEPLSLAFLSELAARPLRP